nr:PREDICTED: beta-glucosidase 4-like [Daucus carota subsp. sativus]
MSQDVYRVAGSTSKKVLPRGTKCVNLEKENMEKKYVNSKDVASLGLTSGVRKMSEPAILTRQKDGRKPSIWDTYAHSGYTNGANGDIACDEYHKHKEDVHLISETGLGAYRFSISWSRLYSEYRSVKSAYYREAVRAMVVYDMTKRLSFDHIPGWLDELRVHADKNIVIMLIGNKSDVGSLGAIPTEDDQKLTEKEKLCSMETSSL